MKGFSRIFASTWNTIGLSLLIIVACCSGFVVLGVTDRTDQEARYIRVLWGAIAYLAMAMNLLLASRLSIIEDIFGGLDKAYKQHRQLGVLALVAATAHYWSPPVFFETSCSTPPCNEVLRPAILAGQASLCLLLTFGALSVVRRYEIKGRQIPYNIWKTSHWIMLLVFIAATFHVMQMPKMPLGYRNFASILGYLGIVAFLTYLFGHILRKRRTYRYKVVSVTKHGDIAIIEARAEGARLQHTAGQFAFLRFNKAGLQEAHPFTISSGENDTHLQFCIKAAGDFTNLANASLEPGDEAIVEGPYGRFGRKQSKTETWIGAGVGITPFLSMAKSQKVESGRHVSLMYLCRNPEDAIDRGAFLEFSKHPDVNYELYLSSEKGRWKCDQSIDGHLLFCGGPNLLNELQKKVKDIEAEEFKFN